MDTSLASNAGRFEWPLTVLAGLNLGREDLGIVAWSKIKVGSKDHDVYIPVDVAQQSVAGLASGLSIVLWSGVQLTSLNCKIFSIGDDGLAINLVLSHDIKDPYYPPGRPIPLKLKDLTSKLVRDSVYRVDVVADSSGGLLSTQLYFIAR